MTNGELERILQFQSNIDRAVLQAQKMQPCAGQVRGLIKNLEKAYQFQSRMQEVAAHAERSQSSLMKIAKETRRMHEAGVFERLDRVARHLQEQTRLAQSITEITKG